MTPIPRILFRTNHKGIGFEVEPNALPSYPLSGMGSGSATGGEVLLPYTFT